MKNERVQFIANAVSTNKLLQKMVEQKRLLGSRLPDAFALYTDFQTSGRGMGSNTWFSDNGKNLLVSFFFNTSLPASRQFIFNEYFALATREILARYVPDVQIKWPNDIYVRGQKIAGILIEHNVKGDKLYQTIAGIGININQEKFPENLPNPTSILLETGRRLEPCDFLKEYQELLLQRYGMVSIENEEEFHQQYLNHLFLKDKSSSFFIHGEKTEATILDVNEYGQLCLQDAEKKQYVCGFKEIIFI